MKKCTDQKGITILMALLLLLVASMVSVVILTAATTAARHISNDRQSQQTYLTVSSAAELLRDDILSSGYEQKVTRRPTATGSYIERTEVTQTPRGHGRSGWSGASRPWAVASPIPTSSPSPRMLPAVWTPYRRSSP